MGAWGARVFENDAALDWLGDLVAGRDPAMIAETLDEVSELGPDAYLEGSMAGNALAAAEVVAAMLGKPMVSPPATMQEWLAQGHRIDGQLVDAALHAIRRIRTKSELRELWEEADVEEWVGVLRELESRLRLARPRV